MKRNVIVFYGGESVEHDISIITAISAMRNIDKEENKIFPVYISRAGVMYKIKDYLNLYEYKDFNPTKHKTLSLITGKPYLAIKKLKNYKPVFRADVALNCLHGGTGENGSFAGLLNICHIPQTASHVLSSSICMNKSTMKLLLKQHKIPTPNFFSFTDIDYFSNYEKIEERIEKMRFPVIVKSANLGSSIGITKVDDSTKISEAIKLALAFDDEVVVEKCIDNLIEINVAVMKNISGIRTGDIEVSSVSGEIYSFEEKYINSLNRKENFELLSIEVEQMKEMAVRVFKLFRCDSIARIDFLFDSITRKFYVSEINTIPGNLAHHLFSEPQKEFLEDLLISAIESYSTFVKKDLNYYSPVFDKYDFTNKKNSKKNFNV